MAIKNNKLLNKFISPDKVAEAEREEITNDGGLGDIGRELQAKIDSGEFNELSNKELMDYYMQIVSLSGNKKLIMATRVAICKKTRPQLQSMLRAATKTAINFSKKN